MKWFTDPLKRSRIMYIIQADLEHLINLLVTGAFLATLTTQLGMSDSLTGIISSFSSLGCLFQMISVIFRKGSVKKFVVFLSLSNQVLFIILYLIPLGSAPYLKYLFIACLFFALFIYNIAHPKKIDWLMSMVDQSKRGVFTANKEIISLVTGIVFNLVMGAVMDYFKLRGETKIALILGAVTLFCLSILHVTTLFLTIDKRPSENEQTKFSLKENLSFFKEKKTLKLVVIFIFYYVTNYSTHSFYGTYQIKELGFSLTTVSVITIVASIVRILVSRFWGSYADKNSFAKMLCMCLGVTVIAHLFAAFATPSNGLIMFSLYTVFYYIGQGGIGSGLINICFDYMPYSKRADFMAFAQALAGLSGFLTTLAISPLVTYIQNSGNKFLGISVYAQQITSIIAVLLGVASVVYIIYVILPMKRIRGTHS